ncbi:SAM-dependent MidA family methyltransferase [Kribbella italica]|uniref:SAM-dependent MidA family methyltransferase n=1 Tax=Kribbella italica TaxID=1540520 RepID=A0A7W9JB85_9ACTN|nr:SAM-dependent MidA family methyltransferase [Kribbella italica]
MRLAREIGASELTDIGAGSGELGRAVAALAPDLTVTGIELDDELPATLTGLVIANEWLDNIPCELAELSDDGEPRYLLEDLSLGSVVEGNDRAWLDAWWPLAEPGDRAEIGTTRDAAWSGVLDRLEDGLAIAIDYGHVRAGRPPYGTLSGFRRGRECDPVPDGSCDITAHVALDSLGGTITTQRGALLTLGVSADRPGNDLARSDPLRYVAGLSSAGEAAELLDPAGLGSFGWVWTARGADVVRRASRALVV